MAIGADRSVWNTGSSSDELLHVPVRVIHSFWAIIDAQHGHTLVEFQIGKQTGLTNRIRGRKPNVERRQPFPSTAECSRRPRKKPSSLRACFKEAKGREPFTEGEARYQTAPRSGMGEGIFHCARP